MLWLCLLLIAVGLVISLPITAVLVRLGHKLQTYDGVGVEGQVKAAARRVPNTGGIAIFLGVALPIAAGLALLWPMATSDAVPGWLPDAVVPHLAGVAERGPGVLALLAALTVLHVVGLIDDRRPLGPIVKLGVMLACIGGVMWAVPGTRLLVAADGYVGGAWLSVLVTVAWFVVVTNAMNFMDNMDGLAGGVTAVAGSCFLAATLGISQAEGGQWFVAAAMALLVGAVLGFLVFNRPKAAIFMGDGGSLVIGFLLAFLTVRTTYVGGDGSGGWYSVLMPLAVLAVPLYDFASVVVMRLSQGRSPLVGDLQHLSHRLVKRGLSRSAAVSVICGLTAITGLSGVLLPTLDDWAAVLVGLQTFVVLAVVAAFEFASSGAAEDDRL